MAKRTKPAWSVCWTWRRRKDFLLKKDAQEHLAALKQRWEDAGFVVSGAISRGFVLASKPEADFMAESALSARGKPPQGAVAALILPFKEAKGRCD